MTTKLEAEKVVIQCAAGTIKGTLETASWSTIDALLKNPPCGNIDHVEIRLLESKQLEAVPLAEIRAIFYVHSFEGDPEHKQLNFHARAPIMEGLWVRLQFSSGEIMEGIIHNSLRYLVDPGFFIQPTDPGSNNKLVYVAKSWLTDHQVLGMRRLS